MTTAIDTNVIVALWDQEDSLHREARKALETVFAEGPLAITGAVYAELLAGPGRDEAFLDEFCLHAGIRVEWEVSEKMWREAGRAYQGYVGRRRKHTAGESRRILADFLIGAHALVNGYKLLTLDRRVYHAAFPKLRIVTV